MNPSGAVMPGWPIRRSHTVEAGACEMTLDEYIQNWKQLKKFCRI